MLFKNLGVVFIIELVFDPLKEKNISEDVRLVIKNFKTNKIELLKIIPRTTQFVLDTTDFETHWRYRYRYEKKGYDEYTGEEIWVQFTDYQSLYPEKKTEDGLKYLLYQNPESKYLAVVFQAMVAPPSYNYVNSLTKSDINRLYIKDDYGTEEKTKCTYYLGQENNFNIDKATQNLISTIINDLNIDKCNTIFIGSSKGGFASIYHGYKFGAGYILPAGPQVLLGDYLVKPNGKSEMHNNIFRSIFGDINDTKKEMANNLMKNVLMNAEKPFPKTNIHIGYWEPHFKKHVVPFMEMANDLGIDNISLHVKDYKSHSGIVEYYRDFLMDNIIKIKNGDYK